MPFSKDSYKQYLDALRNTPTSTPSIEDISAADQKITKSFNYGQLQRDALIEDLKNQIKGEAAIAFQGSALPFPQNAGLSDEEKEEIKKANIRALLREGMEQLKASDITLEKFQRIFSFMKEAHTALGLESGKEFVNTPELEFMAISSEQQPSPLTEQQYKDMLSTKEGTPGDDARADPAPIYGRTTLAAARLYGRKFLGDVEINAIANEIGKQLLILKNKDGERAIQAGKNLAHLLLLSRYIGNDKVLPKLSESEPTRENLDKFILVISPNYLNSEFYQAITAFNAEKLQKFKAPARTPAEIADDLQRRIESNLRLIEGMTVPHAKLNEFKSQLLGQKKDETGIAQELQELMKPDSGSLTTPQDRELAGLMLETFSMLKEIQVAKDIASTGKQGTEDAVATYIMRKAALLKDIQKKDEAEADTDKKPQPISDPNPKPQSQNEEKKDETNPRYFEHEQLPLLTYEKLKKAFESEDGEDKARWLIAREMLLRSGMSLGKIYTIIGQPDGDEPGRLMESIIPFRDVPAGKSGRYRRQQHGITRHAGVLLENFKNGRTLKSITDEDMLKSIQAKTDDILIEAYTGKSSTFITAEEKKKALVYAKKQLHDNPGSADTFIETGLEHRGRFTPLMGLESGIDQLYQSYKEKQIKISLYTGLGLFLIISFINPPLAFALLLAGVTGATIGAGSKLFEFIKENWQSCLSSLGKAYFFLEDVARKFLESPVILFNAAVDLIKIALATPTYLFSGIVNGPYSLVSIIKNLVTGKAWNDFEYIKVATSLGKFFDLITGKTFQQENKIDRYAPLKGAVERDERGKSYENWVKDLKGAEPTAPEIYTKNQLLIDYQNGTGMFKDKDDTAKVELLQRKLEELQHPNAYEARTKYEALEAKFNAARTAVTNKEAEIKALDPNQPDQLKGLQENLQALQHEETGAKNALDAAKKPEPILPSKATAAKAAASTAGATLNAHTADQSAKKEGHAEKASKSHNAQGLAI